LIYLFSDGSSLTPGGAGGWAFVAVRDIVDPIQAKWQTQVGTKIVDSNGGREKTTNNRMEMAAVNEGMKWILTSCGTMQPLTVVADSKYVIDGITKWRKKWERTNFKGSAGAIKNQDIWTHLFANVDQFEVKVKFIHIRGHRGIYWNEYVDRLARNAADEIREQQIGW